MAGWFKKVFGGSTDAVRDASETESEGIYSRFRRQALLASRVEFSISKLSPDLPIWGLLMESGYSEGTATLFALGDGTTSLYLSSGSGIIGGGGHDNVRRANRAFIESANEYYERFKPCRSYPTPEPDHAVFYVLTDSGILTEDALENDLGNNRHPLSPLFYSGQELITQLRRTTEDRDA
jgi:hypothetical protein